MEDSETGEAALFVFGFLVFRPVVTIRVSMEVIVTYRNDF